MGEEADGLHADIDSFCQRIAVAPEALATKSSGSLRYKYSEE